MSEALIFMIAMYELLALAVAITAILSMPYHSTPLNKLFWSVVLVVGMQVPLLPVYLDMYYRY